MSVLVMALQEPLAGQDVPGLCDRLTRGVRATGARTVVVDAAGLGPPGPAALEALARLRLTAGRLGCALRVGNASGELGEMLTWLGLDGVLTGDDAAEAGTARTASGRQPRGQAEEGEQPGGV